MTDNAHDDLNARPTYAATEDGVRPAEPTPARPYTTPRTHGPHDGCAGAGTRASVTGGRRAASAHDSLRAEIGDLRRFGHMSDGWAEITRKLDRFAAEVRLEVAAETRASCPDHGDEEPPGCWPDCHRAVADDLEIEARKLAADAPGGEGR